ncbi:MAG: WG repeat-containing protein [Ruminococcaceae bacterium]|nr:WG repeat-containing protein [Oscillospiraceae bacterium]
MEENKEIFGDIFSENDKDCEIQSIDDAINIDSIVAGVIKTEEIAEEDEHIILSDTPHQTEDEVSEDNTSDTEEPAEVYSYRAKKSGFPSKYIPVIVAVAVILVAVNLISSFVNYINREPDVNLFGESELIPAKNRGKWGYIDKKGNMIVAAAYDSVTDFDNGYAKVMKDNKYGIIDANGTPIVAVEFDDVMLFSDGMAAVMRNKKWGYVNQKGEFKIDLQYEDAREFCEGRAPVKMDGMWGYISKKGEPVGSFIFDDAYPFSENGLALVKYGGRYGYVNTRSNIKIATTYDKAESFNEDGYAVVNLGDKVGVIDKSGDYVLNPEFGAVIYAGEDNFIVKSINSRFGVIDNDARWIIDPEYSEIASYKDKIAVVRNGSYWGYVDDDGDEITPMQFEEARPFSKAGFAVTASGGKYGFVEDDGDTVIFPTYDDIGEFINEITWAKVGDSFGFINDDGKFVIQPQYKEASCFYDDGYAIVLDRDKRYTLINQKGESFGKSFEGIKEYCKKCCKSSGCFDECIFDSEYCYEHSKLK